MFNGRKTEVLFIHSKHMHLEPFPPLKICNDLVNTSLSACNLGLFFYECLIMEKQVSAVSQCGFFHLRNIAKCKCYLIERSLLIVAHSFMINMMNYCNSLLFGFPNTRLYKLHHLQNPTAKLITKAKV